MNNKPAINARDILYPKSIAVVGASKHAGSIGNTILKNVLEHGFKGKVYPVNPNEQELLGLKCYPSLLDIPEPVDLACIVIPSKAVLEVVKQAAAKHVKGLIIYSSGFAEKGPDGERYQAEVVNIAKSAGVRIIGPNTNGLFNGEIDLHLTFNPLKTMKGPVGVITQSGGMMSGFAYEAIRNGIPVNKFVNLENKSDVNEVELLELMEDDELIKVVFMYLESIVDTDSFVKVSKRVSKKKPILGYLAGLYDGGKRIISMHTGSKHADLGAVEKAFEEGGVIRVRGITEAIDAIKALAFLPVPEGNRMGFVTNTGGISAVMADICEANGLKIPPFSEELAKRVRDKLPPGLGYPYNPVDTTANVNYDVIKGALTELIESDEVDIVVAAGIRSVFIPYDHFERSWGECFQLSKEKGKPLIGVIMGDDGIFDKIIKPLTDIGMPVYTSPERAALSLVYLHKYSEMKRRHSL
ncbi:MAG: CoA-binding protein [Candidatus Caldarchaeum sp.]